MMLNNRKFIPYTMHIQYTIQYNLFTLSKRPAAHWLHENLRTFHLLLETVLLWQLLHKQVLLDSYFCFSVYPVYVTFVSSKSIHSAIKCYLIKVRLKCNKSISNTLQRVIFSTFFQKNLNFIK